MSLGPVEVALNDGSTWRICDKRITVKFGCEASELMTAVPTAIHSVPL